MPDQPQKHPHHALLDELIRLILLKIVEDFEPAQLDKMFSMPLESPELLQLLKSHGDSRHAKISLRTPAPMKRTATGAVDFTPVSKEVSALFKNMRQKKGA